MKYLLDTDICIYLIKKQPPSVIKRLNELENDQVALSTISLYELQFGVENSQYQQQSQRALDHFLEPIRHILSVDQPVARTAAKVRANLKRRGSPIGAYDILIAAVALSNRLVLVTNNTKEFQRVDGLKLENWSKKIYLS